MNAVEPSRGVGSYLMMELLFSRTFATNAYRGLAPKPWTATVLHLTSEYRDHIGLEFHYWVINMVVKGCTAFGADIVWADLYYYILDLIFMWHCTCPALHEGPCTIKTPSKTLPSNDQLLPGDHRSRSDTYPKQSPLSMKQSSPKRRSELLRPHEWFAFLLL